MADKQGKPSGNQSRMGWGSGQTKVTQPTKTSPKPTSKGTSKK